MNESPTASAVHDAMESAPEEVRRLMAWSPDDHGETFERGMRETCDELADGSLAASWPGAADAEGLTATLTAASRRGRWAFSMRLAPAPACATNPSQAGRRAAPPRGAGSMV